MNHNYSLVIFDWDGTLMDSTMLIANCVQNAFRDTQLPIPSLAAAKNIIGLGLKEAITALYAEADDVLIQKIAAAYRVHFFAAKQNQDHLFEGVVDVLDQLHGNGYQLAVATGKSRRGLDKVLHETKLKDYFVTSRAADETKSKPDPLMLHEILHECHLQAEQAIIVGDTTYDLEMAQTIGMPRLGVSYGAHSVARLKEHQPIACVDHIRDILLHV